MLPNPSFEELFRAVLGRRVFCFCFFLLTSGGAKENQSLTVIHTQAVSMATIIGDVDDYTDGCIFLSWGRTRWTIDGFVW